jgi:glutathione S-transferase
MKLYNSLGPNPRLVRMCMAEKGIDLEKIEIDLMAGENRQEPYVNKNPAGEMPAMELDDGRILAETVAMCEYLEELHPEPSLLGADAESRAITRMWIRRVELRITNPITDAFRSAEGAGLFKERRHLIPQAADDWKAIAQEGFSWLDEQIAGRDYIAGDSFTLADIVAYNLVDFGIGVGQPFDPSLKNVSAWFERVGARPSAEASLHPVAVAAGMRG